MNKKPALFFFAAAFFASLFFSGIDRVSAIGQITEPIVIADALRGQEIKETVTLMNSEDNAVVFELKGSGLIADWVSFYNEKDLTNKITEYTVSPAFYNDLIAIFRVPSDIPNGVYEGAIDVIVSNDKNQSDQSASVGFSVSRLVSITVSGKEVIDIQAEIIPVKYTVNAGEAAQIRVVYNNTGNVATEPAIQLKVTRAGQSVFNAIFPYADGLDAVKAGERKEMPLVEWQTAGQRDGDYDAEVSILINGKVFKTEKITFTVKPEGMASLASIGNVGGFGYAAIWIPVALLAGILIIGLIFVAKKKKTT